ncbi:MAG: hypothetical protein Q4D37_04945 [Oscillospiraceae bacterium]|nr:hypothetical protein [Oscillospiraceae bacterium]
MKNKKSTQNLLGLETFGRFGLCVNKEELVFFHIQPTNISVLSAEHMDGKIYQLMQLLSCVPKLEIIALDNCQRFDENKIYLKKRLAEEQNPQVKRLLQADLVFLDQMQTKRATARQFLFCIRVRNLKKQQSQAICQVYKTIAEYGFSVRHMEKSDLKHMLAVYFQSSMQGEQMPDVEGENYLEVQKNDNIS